MHKSLLLLALLTSACVIPIPETQEMKDARVPTLPANPCESKSAGRCSYFNAPVTLKPGAIRIKDRALPFYRTAKSIEFIDARPNKWVAPSGTLTDGASIPKMFFKVIGTPQSKEFINAATLHDAYCGVGNGSLPQFHSDTWQNVHRMFYDALRVDGTSPKKAKIMYAAVYLAGPRWSMPGTAPKVRAVPGLLVITAPIVAGPPNTPLPKLVPEEMLVEEMQAAMKFINATNPSFRRLETYLRKREQAALIKSGNSSANAEQQETSNSDNGVDY